MDHHDNKRIERSRQPWLLQYYRNRFQRGLLQNGHGPPQWRAQRRLRIMFFIAACDGWWRVLNEYGKRERWSNSGCGSGGLLHAANCCLISKMGVLSLI